MIRNHDHHNGHEQTRQSDDQLKRAELLTAVPKGYQPDDDDPAWPSRSGQAD